MLKKSVGIKSLNANNKEVKMTEQEEFEFRLRLEQESMAESQTTAPDESQAETARLANQPQPEASAAVKYSPENVFARMQGVAEPTTVTTPNVQSAADLVSSYPERIGNIIDTRKAEVDRARQMRDEGSSSSGEMYLRMIGKGGAGTAMDVIGETVGTAVGAAADLYDPKIRQGFNDLMAGVVNSDAAKSAIELYQGMDENTRSNVESIFNIANVMSPFRFKAKAGSGFADTLREGTKVVSKSQDMKRNMLRNVFQPERSAKNIDFELRKGTEHIDRMVNDLMDVKGVSPMFKPETNLGAVQKHMNSIEAKIQGELSQFDKTGLMRNVETSFGQMVNDTINNAPSLRELGLTDAKKIEVQDSLMRKFKGITANMKDEGVNPNSLRGLMMARRKLDKVLREADFKKMTDGQIGDIALEKHIVMDMRSKLNDVISGFVEQTGKPTETIKSLLKKQSSMYSAFDNLATKTAREGQNLGDKNWLSKAISTHPLIVYNTMRSSGTPAAAAMLLAAPSAVKLGGEAVGAVNRTLSTPNVPLVRSGLFYGSDEQQAQ
jgi:hypothetical protein